MWFIIIQLTEFFVKQIGLLKILDHTYYSDPKYTSNVKKGYFLDAVIYFSKASYAG